MRCIIIIATHDRKCLCSLVLEMKATGQCILVMPENVSLMQAVIIFKDFCTLYIVWESRFFELHCCCVKPDLGEDKLGQ